MKPLTLSLRPGDFSIYQFEPGAAIPSALSKSWFYSVTHTADEISVVAQTQPLVRAPQESSGWKCLQVEGPLDLSLTGIASTITSALADAKVSVFPLASFATDYFFVKSDSLGTALEALRRAGCQIRK